MRLLSCPSCAGFVPPLASSCPHCAATLGAPAFVRALAVGSALATSACFQTVVAIYGLPPCELDEDVDVDGDGFAPAVGDDESCIGGADFDCDDNDDAVHPGADDVAVDDIDQDCNGVDGPVAEGEGEGEGE